MKHYWSEPYKEKSLWYVDKIDAETGKRMLRHEFASNILATGWITTVHIYVDGELMYSGS